MGGARHFWGEVTNGSHDCSLCRGGLVDPKYQVKSRDPIVVANEQIPRVENIESLLYCDGNFAKRCSRWQMTTVGRNAAYPEAFQSKGDARVAFRPETQ
jgi:hypothetical protein